MHGDLAGRTVAVNSGAREIGFETARRIVRLGGRVAIFDMDGAAARDAAITAGSPRTAQRFAADAGFSGATASARGIARDLGAAQRADAIAQ